MMFLNDVHKKEEIKGLASQDLRTLGIKFRLKKPSRQNNVQKTKSRKVFKVPLQSLPMQTVTLTSGQQLVVPKILHEMCSFILTKVKTEGLFRKGGSKSRQNEIKLSLDAGCYLGDDHHEIDVASVLKTFFRELPDPIIPVPYQDPFLHCILSNYKLRAILLLCLLLPSEHLNTLAYLMQFLYEITQHADYNKMDAYNLAVVIGPTLLPVEEKVAPSTTYRINKFCEIFKLMIENASTIGIVPDDIIERIALSCSSTSLTDEDVGPLKKKKKRRSGSLTRMLNGLKKIVTSKSNEETSQEEVITPDLLATPLLTRSTKKRKFDGAGFSIRKKKDLITKLPQNSTLATPFNPKNKEKEKKWLLKSKSKSSKDETASISSKTSTGTRTMLERRWSQLSHVADFRKKKRNSYGGTTTANVKLAPIETNLDELDLKIEAEYVKIPRVEYEEIKSRVSEIERRISIELESEPTRNHISNKADSLDTVQTVQSVYEHTLEQLEPLSPTTDQLAKRLSRELKIRRSEQKVMRSPSARKIGSLRRRSRESDRQKLVRTKTWHISTLQNSIELPLSPKNKVHITPVTPKSHSFRSLSFNGTSSNQKPKSRLSDNWQSSKEFFENSEPSNGFESGERCRASLIRLRHQNAGMVLAKARLFDDLDSNSVNNATPNLPRVQTTKLGATRKDRQSYRIRSLKAEEKRKKNTPRRQRTPKSPNTARQRLRLRSDALEEGNLNNKENDLKDGCVLGNPVKRSPLRDSNYKDASTTPRTVPHIKRPFNVKSPKRLHRGGLNQVERNTPLKVIATIQQDY